MEQEIQKKGEVILYHPSETIKLEVRLENETVWLTQAQMAELFNVKIPAVNKHVNNIYSEGELDKDSTISILETVRTEGTRKVIRKVIFYNLDVIISVGYRIKSFAGTKFRQWASSVLKEYLIKGYVVNNNALAMMQKQIDDRFISLQEHTDNRLHDVEKHLEQHDEQIELRETTQRIHDRFLIIDDVVYHLGASLNELGRRLFAFSKMSIRKGQIL